MNSYVDDIVAGADNLHTMIKLRDEYIDLLRKGRFDLHKWCSNYSLILVTISTERWLVLHFLKFNKTFWPTLPGLQVEVRCEAKKKTRVYSHVTRNPHTICEYFRETIFPRFSAFTKLQRVLTYVLRFINNCRSNNRESGYFSTQELKHSLNVILKVIQLSVFDEEIESLMFAQENHGAASGNIKNSNLHSLKPFIDYDGVLRIGGRLRFASIPSSQKHPTMSQN